MSRRNKSQRSRTYHLFFDDDEEKERQVAKKKVAKGWEDFDCRSGEHGFYIDAVDRLRWDNIDVMETLNESATAEGKTAGLIPLVPNENLTEEEAVKLSTIFTEDEFDPALLPIRLKYDPMICQYNNLAHPPDCTKNELERYEERANFIPSTLQQTVSAQFFHDLLSKNDTSVSSTFIRYEPQQLCVPLLWFCDKVFRLPLKASIVERLIIEMKDLVVTAPATASNLERQSTELWKQAMQIYCSVQQDVADFLWHAGVRLADKEVEEEVAVQPSKKNKR
jgi:hypothetical protein